METHASRQPAQLGLLDHAATISVRLPQATSHEIYILNVDTVTVGRDESCDIVVNQPVISRLHARIVREGPRYVLYDLGSTNGTFVNEQRLLRRQAHTLEHHDAIGFGSRVSLLRFLDNDRTQEVVDEALHWNQPERCFYLKGQPLALKPREERLLTYFYEHQQIVLTHEACIEAVWERYLEDDTQRLTQLVSDLKKAIMAVDPQTAHQIENIRGKGYRMTGTSDKGLHFDDEDSYNGS